MKRYGWLILVLILLTIVALLFTTGTASAFTVSGGTPEQRAWVREAIEAQHDPGYAVTDAYYRGVDVQFVDHYPPYWEVAAASAQDDLFLDFFPAGAVGVAWPGNIRIIPSYPPGAHGFLGEIATHEYSHNEWMGPLGSAARTNWNTVQSPGDHSDWYHSSAESFAEQNRIANWPSLYYQTLTPRTQLRILGNTAFLAWKAEWSGAVPTTTTTVPPTTTTTMPPTTTTTTVQNNLFPDIDPADFELWSAAWWARGMFIGYVDGTFGPYDPMLRRHVALVVDRWTGLSSALVPWLDDWTPATRGDVRDAVPGLSWDSERLGETILRSQMLRLMYRGGE